MLQTHLPFDDPYAPRFKRTDGVKYFLESIERRRWSFENLLADPNYEKWFKERALIRRVHSSTTIEGNRLDEDQAARLIRGENVDAEETQKREVLNMKRTLEFVDEIARDASVGIDEPVIREINRRVLAGSAETITPGEYRRGQNYVRNPLRGGIAYTPPNPGDVRPLMRQLGLWLRGDHDQQDGPLVAGIAHARIAEIHPFWDGNGRTARALEALILDRYGYGFNQLLSPERQFVWELRNYFEQLGKTVGENFKEGRSRSRWLEYFLMTLTAEIELVWNELVDFRRIISTIHSDVRPLGLTRRQRDVLAYAYIHGSIQIREYEEIFRRSPESARRDLKPLIALGALKPFGHTRSRRFVFDANDQFWDLIRRQRQRIQP